VIPDSAEIRAEILTLRQPGTVNAR